MTQECLGLKFENVFAMPNKRTFTIKPIADLITSENGWRFDEPFPFEYKIDALDHLWTFRDNSLDGVLFDPPYSPRQLKECYDSIGQSWDGTSGIWSQWEARIASVIKPGGKCIKFGWNSHKIRKDFETTRILLVNHGGHHNDTIVTVQKKMNQTLCDYCFDRYGTMSFCYCEEES